MRRISICAVVFLITLVIANISASAPLDEGYPTEVDHIGLYLEPDATGCNAPIDPGDIVTLNILAVMPNIGDEGLVAAEFRIDGLPENGAEGIYSVTWNTDLVIGDIGEGVAVAFDDPIYGGVVALGSITFNAFSDAWLEEDSVLRAAVALDSGNRVIVNGNYDVVTVSGSSFTFNCTVPPLCECGVFDAPICDIQPAALDFGSVVIGDFACLDITITNTGDGLLEGHIYESCMHFVIAEGGGIFSLSAGQSQVVTVCFQPTAEGNQSCYIEMATDGENDCELIPVSGTGLNDTASCTANPSFIYFESIPPNHMASRDFYVANTGSELLIGDLATAGDGFLILVGGGYFELASGDTLTGRVGFFADCAQIYHGTLLTGLDGCPSIELYGEIIETNIPGSVPVIGIFAGECATTCDADIDLDVTRTLYIYALLTDNIDAVAAAEFRIDNLPDSGSGGTVTENWNADAVFGDSESGITLSFYPPLEGPFVQLGTIDFLMTAEDWIGQNYDMDVEPSLNTNRLMIVDEYYNWHYAEGWGFRFNCTYHCECIPTTPVLLSRFDLNDLGGAAHIEWECALAGDVEYRLEASMDSESWIVDYREIAPGLYEAKDEAAPLATGGRVDYRLSGRAPDEEWQLLREASLSVSHIELVTGLLAPHPNPFNPTVSIPFSLARPGPLRIAIYDVAGRQLITLIDGDYQRGNHIVNWRGQNAAGRDLPSGVYFARMEAPLYEANRKLILLR